jgi:hypothetical protein
MNTAVYEITKCQGGQRKGVPIDEPQSIKWILPIVWNGQGSINTNLNTSDLHSWQKQQICGYQKRFIRVKYCASNNNLNLSWNRKIIMLPCRTPSGFRLSWSGGAHLLLTRYMAADSTLNLELCIGPSTLSHLKLARLSNGYGTKLTIIDFAPYPLDGHNLQWR